MPTAFVHEQPIPALPRRRGGRGDVFLMIDISPPAETPKPAGKR